jgi:hypothetical protein
MSRFRYRDDESSTGTTVAGVLLGALAGFAVGMFVAQRVGGFSGIAARFRKRNRNGDEALAESVDAVDAFADDTDSIADEESEDWTDSVAAGEEGAPLLEERVLEAFNNDPILAERAIDIGSIGDGIIELAGWVDDPKEAEHAMTLAHGVPGVETVVNRLMVEDEERELNSTVQRGREGDASLNETGWEGQQVGTGKRRQGTSDEADRHEDPKPELENRWLSQEQAVKNPAEELADIKAERRRAKKAASDEASRGD